jgi:hypothetical protein
MTSTLTLGPEHQRLEGRTVRDIVEHDPAQVNEVWCRKIFRQLLQSLELQYAMHMPHRAITPDTVVFHDNGEPLLLPSGLDVADVGQSEAADLEALARVVHFAITRELAPAGPLHGRNLEGYSDSLITAVDRCMAPDPAERPHSIDELRHILGIVSLGPAAPMPMPAPAAPPIIHPAALETAPAAAAIPVASADTLPSFMRDADTPRTAAGLSRWQRWAVAAGGGAVLIAIALAVFAELRDSGSYDHIVLTLPQSGEQPHGPTRDQAAPASDPLPAQREPQAAADAGPQQPATRAPELPPPGAPQPAASAAAIPAPVPAPRSFTKSARPNKVPAGAAAGSAAYRLQIQPWGVIYVDGVDRGVSPPVKRLVLAPGRHTIRIANPNFHDRVLEVDTGAGSGQIAINFSDEPR